MKKHFLRTAFAVVLTAASSNSFAQWNGSTVSTTTNSNVGINNSSPANNLTIGAQATGPFSNTNPLTGTTKVLIQENNPFIQLQDITTEHSGFAVPQSMTGIKIMTSLKTYSISAKPVSNGHSLVIKDESNSATPKILFADGKLIISPAESVTPNNWSKGNILLNDNVAVSGTLIVGENGNTVGMPKALQYSEPGYSVYVKYGILAERVKVAGHTTVNWSDFVFDKNYKLRSLAEVESYIKENHHLPEIPSTEEVHKDGVDLLEMDAKLLMKVEELTLYMIEIKKENEELKKRIQVLEKK